MGTFEKTATLPPSFKKSASKTSPRKPDLSPKEKSDLSPKETFTKKVRKFRVKWPTLKGLKKKDKKAKLPEDEVEADAEVEKVESDAGVQRTRRNSCPDAKEMAEVVEVVVDMVVEAQKKVRSRPTSILFPAETSADGGGGRTNRPLSLKAVTDEPLPATVLINTQTHDSRTPRQTSSWVVLGEEPREESDPTNETHEETVSANQAVIEATKSLVSSLFPWAVDMVLKNENIKETTEGTSTNENEFDEALGELKEIKPLTHPSFSEDRRPSLLESLLPSWAVGSPAQEYATPMESPEPTDDDAVMTTKTNDENAENTEKAVSEDRRPSLFDAIWPWATRGEDQFTAQIKLRAAEAGEAERKAEEAEQAKRETERKAEEEAENAKRVAEVVQAH